MKSTALDRVLFLLISAAAVGVIASPHAHAGTPEDTMPKSLFAHINNVTVLDIATDRPIRAYRCLINGKAINGKAERQWSLKGNSKHLYVAVVRSSVYRGCVEIHMAIGSTGCLIATPFKYHPDKSTQTGSEYMPLEREVAIKNWTTIYRLAVHEGDTTVRSLELQIRGDPDPRKKP